MVVFKKINCSKLSFTSRSSLRDRSRGKAGREKGSSPKLPFYASATPNEKKTMNDSQEKFEQVKIIQIIR